jgi:hypothetical protein
LWIWFVHSFLKLSKTDISDNFRFLAGVLGCRRGRIETEQQNDQDEDEWRHAHGRKIARAMMASRTPSNGLVTANQNETSQSDFLAVVFMRLSQAFEDRHFTEREISFETLNELRRTWIVASGLGWSKGHSHPAKKYIRPVFMFGHLSGNRIPDVLIAWNEPDRRSDGEIVELSPYIDSLKFQSESSSLSSLLPYGQSDLRLQRRTRLYNSFQ